MKHHGLLYTFFYVTFTLTVPPQNVADRHLLDACQRKNEFDIAQALCLGANKGITDERGRSLSKIVYKNVSLRIN